MPGGIFTPDKRHITLKRDGHLYCMFLIIGIPSIKLSELAVDLSQRNIFVFILQACLRLYRNTKETQMRRNEINFGGKRQILRDPGFQAGSSSKQVLRTLGDTFAAEGVCVCVCEEFQRAGQGDSGRSSHPGYTPTRPAPPLLRDPPPLLHPVESHSSFLYIKGTVERYHPNQKRCDHLRAGSTGPLKGAVSLIYPSLAT